MAEDDLHLGHALGAGSPDVVLTQHIQHGGTGQTGDICHGRQRQRNDRQDQAFSGSAVGGEQCQLQCEDQQQQRTHNKGRHGDERGGHDHDYLINELVAAQRCNRTQNHTHDQSNGCSDQTQLGGDFHAVDDDVDDIAATELHRWAEVELRNNILQISGVLFEDRLIQSVLCFQCSLCRFGDSLLTEEGTAGHCAHNEEGDGDDDPNRQHSQQNTLQNIFQSFRIH